MKPNIKKIKCPHCKKEAPWESNPHRPFCSERCRMVDLGHWSMENYRISGEKAENETKKKEEDEDVD